MNPNVIPNYSHRSETFKSLYRDVEARLLDLAGLNPATDAVLMLTGSGTLANETVIASAVSGVDIQSQGLFSSRLVKMSALYNAPDIDTRNRMGVQYETGVSHYVPSSHWDFADCVSAFPYYDLPDEAVVCTTVSSKQLGAETGLSLIFIRNVQETLARFHEAAPSYLSLVNYYEYSRRWQTPNTPAITALESLGKVLKSFQLDAFRRMIDARRAALLETATAYGLKHTGDGPVFTFASNLGLPQLYSNSGTSQAFLWAGTDDDYVQLISDLKEM